MNNLSKIQKFIFAFLLISLVLVTISCNNKPNLNDDSDLKIIGEKDFGTIKINTSLYHEFTIENTSEDTVTLTDAGLVSIGGEGSDSFDLSSKPNRTIDPNETTSFTIVFKPRTEGRKTAIISIPNSTNKKITFEVSGEGKIPKPIENYYEDFETGDLHKYMYELSGKEYPFVQKTERYEGEYAVQFGNPDSNFSSYEITDISVKEESMLKFYYKVSSEKNNDFFNFSINGMRMVHESGITDWVRYSKILTKGTYRLTWEYSKDISDAVGMDTAWVDAVSVISTSEVDPEIDVMGSNDFGRVIEGRTISKTFTIKNIGDGRLNLPATPQVSISGSEAFKITKQPNSSIAPGDSSKFTVSFNPTEEAEYTAKVRIENNDPDNNPTTIDIKGEGIDKTSQQDGWLFMMYLDGDNDLNSNIWGDLNEMEYGLSMLPNELRNNVHFVVLWDGNGEHTSNGPNSTCLYELGPEDVENVQPSSETVELSDAWFSNGDELDMGNGETLQNFIKYAMGIYPNIEHNVLMMSNHGGGVRSVKTSRSNNRLGWVDDTNNGQLYTNEIHEAIQKALEGKNKKLDILGFDACLMSVVEEAYEYRDMAEYFIASPNTEQADGWEYNHWIPQIISSTTAEQLSEILVESYHLNFDTYSGQSETLSAIRLTEMENLKIAIDKFAEKLYSEGVENGKESELKEDIKKTPRVYLEYQKFLGFLCDIIMKDYSYTEELRNSARELKNTIGEAVVYAWAGTMHGGGYLGYGHDIQNGLLIVTKNYAWYSQDEVGACGKLDFCTKTDDGVVNTWKELVEEWF